MGYKCTRHKGECIGCMECVEAVPEETGRWEWYGTIDEEEEDDDCGGEDGAGADDRGAEREGA